MRLHELEGRTLDAIDGAAGQWVFRFAERNYINVECDWRIVIDGHIALARRDHEQMFGLKEPVNALAEAERALKGRRVVRAELHSLGDLVLEFDGARLETFTNSSGYESCTVWLSNRRLVVVLGGGELSVSGPREAAEPGDEADTAK